MGLFDSLRSKRGKETSEEVESATGASDTDRDLDWFKPRTDGIYLGAVDAPVPYLRFTAAGRVQETWTDKGTDAARAILALKSDDRAEGEFSRGGVMSVVRRFERPIVYTVQDTGFVEGADGLLDSFTARCTNTNTRETTAIGFSFSPDAG